MNSATSAARIHNYHITMVSDNKKVGPIPCTTTGRNSCWEGCPFYGGPCYGNSFHARLHWDRVSDGRRGYSMDVLCKLISDIPKYSFIRINQTGDQPRYENGDINLDEALPLAKACRMRKLKAWTYCHHEQTDYNLAALRTLTQEGITTNASCETEEQVDRVYAQGGLAVLVVDPDEKRTKWTTEGGVPVRVCPEQLGLVANCLNCEAYCQKQTTNTGGGTSKPRDCVAFLGHYAPKQIKKLLKEMNVR